MTCHKGKYYIHSRDEYNGDIALKINGYILSIGDDLYGFTRGVDGMYIVSDIATGGKISGNVVPGEYNLMASYRELRAFVKNNAEMMQKIRKTAMHREAAAMIRAAYAKDGGTDAD